MATIRKLRSKWQAQVRLKGHKPQARSFILKSDAVAWARIVLNKNGVHTHLYDPVLAFLSTA